MEAYHDAITVFFCVWTVALIAIGILAHFAWRAMTNGHDDKDL